MTFSRTRTRLRSLSSRPAPRSRFRSRRSRGHERSKAAIALRSWARCISHRSRRQRRAFDDRFCIERSPSRRLSQAETRSDAVLRSGGLQLSAATPVNQFRWNGIQDRKQLLDAHWLHEMMVEPGRFRACPVVGRSPSSARNQERVWRNLAHVLCYVVAVHSGHAEVQHGRHRPKRLCSREPATSRH
jgi:hypothetical protein